MNNNEWAELDISSPIEVEVEDEFTSECVTLPPELCVEKGTYTIVTSLPDNSNGYQIVYQRCCRNDQVINIEDPEDMGSSLVAYIPPSSNVDCNSSPVFDSFPPLALCLGTDIEIIQSATDIDGDSLTISANYDSTKVLGQIEGMRLNLTPAKDYVGSTDVTVIVSDGALYDTAKFVFIVNNVNDCLLYTSPSPRDS